MNSISKPEKKLKKQYLNISVYFIIVYEFTLLTII